MLALAVVLVLLALAGRAVAQRLGAQGPAAPLGGGFSYQGQLTTNNVPVYGACDLRFGLWDAPTGGAQLGAAQTLNAVPVHNGLFTVRLNDAGEFGANAFNGDARWLETAVRCPAGAGVFSTLPARQALDAAPAARRALRAGALTHSPYEGVLVVAQSGGDFTSIQSALDSANAGPDRPFLVWVAPGTYSETVTMKPYVDIEGAGELVTIITALGGYDNRPTIVGSNNAELRHLTVVSVGTTSFAKVMVNDQASPYIRHVTFLSQGGVATGVYNKGGTPHFEYVTITANGGPRSANTGLYNENASPTMTFSTIYCGGGLDSANYAVYNAGASSPIISASHLTGFGGDSGYGMFSEAGSAPVIGNSTITGLGGDILNTGIYNQGASPTLQDVLLSATTGVVNVGVYNTDGASPLLNNVTMVVRDGSVYNMGVYSFQSTVTLVGVRVIAQYANNCIGMRNQFSDARISRSVIGARNCSGVVKGIDNIGTAGSYRVTIDQSHILSTGNTVVNDAAFNVEIGDTQLEGNPITGGGTVTCVGVYDENYASPGYTVCP